MNFFEQLFYVIVGSIAFGILLFVWALWHDREKEVALKNRVHEFAKKSGVTPSKIFIDASKEKAVSTTNALGRLVYVCKDENEWLDVADVLDIEVHHDKRVIYSVQRKSGGLTRAAVGGLLFGGAGAIVGAATAQTKQDSIRIDLHEVHLTVKGARHPHYCLAFETSIEARELVSTIHVLADG